MSVTTLVAAGDDLEITGDAAARYPIYSVTKTVVAAAVLLLCREGALELSSVRRLLDHTSGVRDYGSLPEYHEAVRTRPGSAWGDDEFLARTAAAGPVFEPGEGWSYSNTGYLMLRRLLDEHGGLAAFLPRLGLADATVAETAEDLDAAVPSPSRLLLDGVEDVRIRPAVLRARGDGRPRAPARDGRGSRGRRSRLYGGRLRTPARRHRRDRPRGRRAVSGAAEGARAPIAGGGA